MIIRTSLFGKMSSILMLLSFIIVPALLFYYKGAPKGGDLILFIGIIFLYELGTFCVVIIAFSTRITLSPQGIFLKRRLGAGAFLPKEYGFRWHEIDGVSNYLGNYFPFKLFWISGTWDGHHQQIFLGSFFTQKKESLVYVVDHVHHSVVTRSAKKQARRYRRRLEKKANKLKHKTA